MIAYGHASISYDGRTFDFIPSFKNIEKIGTPKQIIDTFNLININHFDKAMFAASMHVLECCIEGEDKDLTPIFGGLTTNYHGDQVWWIKGAEPHQNAVIMARHMLNHGVCGKTGSSKGSSSSDTEAVTEFKPSEYVAIARRILEIGLSEAKNMTMTELIMMADDINKANEKSKKASSGDQDVGTPTLEEHQQAMALRNRIHH